MARLIDTSVFIELERRGRPLGEIATGALTEPLALASVTASELLFGVDRADSPERRRRRSKFVELVLSSLRIFPLDVGVARVHAHLWAHLERSGQRIGPYDMIVAATAIAHGFDVLTFNVREFERVPDPVVWKPDW